MTTTLEEMGIVMRAVPGPDAGADEIADWYTRKAHLLDRLAVDMAGTEAVRMHKQAVLARRHAAKLLDVPAQRPNDRRLEQRWR